MRRLSAPLGVVVACGILVTGANAWAQARAHLDHVQKSWNDTPGQVSLIAILEEEARFA